MGASGEHYRRFVSGARHRAEHLTTVNVKSVGVKSVEHERCGKCSRKLKDPKSRNRGFGPCCYRKYQKAKAKEEFEKNQQQLDM